jgi:cyclomaltodextrinase
MKTSFISIIASTVLLLGNIFAGGGDSSMAKTEFVPDWAKDAVWYQVFPERFRNGNRDNDPKIENLKGAYPHDITSPWQIHPWESDWYELQPYEKGNGKDIWFNLQRRRYGGDLQGVIDKLGYIKDLGINAIYLNPVFQAPSLHKYDGISFHHVDPNFGNNPEADRELISSESFDDPTTWKWTNADKLVLELIQKAHKLGIRVIFDGVFNHMGISSIPFRDVVENQEKSRFKNWFSIKSFENKEKGTKFEYEGWFGVKELPEIKEDENGIVAEPKKYIFDITKRWMDPNGDGNPADGIDGWRLDVAFCIKHPFWKDWRSHVKSINNEAYLTAEVIDPIDVIEPYLQGDEFDAVMNYNFGFACADFILAEKTRISASEFDEKLAELRSAFPGGVEYVQQNLFGSHDANRIGSHAMNADLGRYGNWGKWFNISRGSNDKYNTAKPTEQALKKQKLFAILQMTYVGAPMIYYGDEVGMWGANDPDCRKPMVWDDLKYQPEIYNPDGSKRSSPEEVKVNNDLLGHYKKLINIRNSHPSLRRGSYKTIKVDDEHEIFGFERKFEGEEVLVFINNSDVKRTTTVLRDGKYNDLLNGGELKFSASYNLLEIPAKWGVILLKR